MSELTYLDKEILKILTDFLVKTENAHESRNIDPPPSPNEPSISTKSLFMLKPLSLYIF